MTRSRLLARIGFRSGSYGGGAATLHRWSLLAAAAVAVLACWLLIATHTVAGGRMTRVAAREPVFVADESSAAASARWVLHADAADGHQFLILYIAPLHPDATPPPGLTRWPSPGEVFLSPELAHGPSAAELDRRYGRFGGVIGDAGLADASERLAYYRPYQDTVFDERTGPVAISGFGVNPSLFGDQYAPLTLTSLGQRWTARDVEVLLACLVAFPSAILLLIAVRTNAERRDRRLAILDVLGASAYARSCVLLGEAALPTIVGAAVGAAASLVASVVGLRIPLADFGAWPSDMASSRLLLLPVGLGVVAVVSVLVVVVQLRRAAPRQTRPRATAARLRGPSLAAFPLALAATVWAATTARGQPQSAHPITTTVFLVGTLVTLASLPFVLGAATSVLGRAIAVSGIRYRRASAVIAGRWLQARPTMTARLCTAVVVGIGLLVQVQVQQGWVVARTIGLADAAAPSSVAIGNKLVAVRSTASANGTARFTGDMGEQDVFRVVISGDRAILIGDCDALRRLGTTGTCGRAVRSMDDAFANLNAVGTALRYGTEISDPNFAVTTDQRIDGAVAGFFVLNDAGDRGYQRIARAAYADLTAPYVTVAGQDWIVGGVQSADVYDWVLAIGIVGLLVVGAAGAVASAAMFVSHATTLGVVGTFDARVRRYVTIGLFNVGLPIALATVAGSAIAVLLGLLTIQIRGAGAVGISRVGWVVITVGASGIVLATWCGVTAAVLVRRWHPRAD